MKKNERPGRGSVSVRINRVERLNLAFSAGAVAASYALVSPGFAGGVAVGAAIEAANFRALFRAGKLFFAGQLGSWSVGWALRYGLLSIGIGVAIYLGVHPVGLVIGLSLILPAAVIEAWQSRPAIDPNAPALAPDDPSWKRWDPWLARERDDDAEDDG
jgi:hypothetical protein